MNIQDVSGNDFEIIVGDVSDDYMSMEETWENSDVSEESDVSSGNAYIESAHSISGGDSYAGTGSQTLAADNTEIIESLSALNYSVTALLFFTVFVWAESKLHSGVRRLSEKWKK